MKIFELCYIIGIFLIIISIGSYALSIAIIGNPAENSVSNLLGETTEIDTIFTTDEVISDLRAMERYENMIILWIGIPLGIVVFLAGLIIKRKKEGPDLFIDDQLEDDEESDFPLF